MRNHQKHRKRQIQWMNLTVKMMEQDFRRKTVKTQVPQMKKYGETTEENTDSSDQATTEEQMML